MRQSALPAVLPFLALAQLAGAATTPAARVNGVEISRTGLDREVEATIAAARAAGHPEPVGPARDQVRGEVLDRLIATELIYQAAKSARLMPSDEEVAREWAELEKGFGDESHLRQSLAKQGLSAEVVREDLRRELAVRRWLEREVEARVTVSDEQVRKYFDEHPDEFVAPAGVKAAHLLVAVPQGAPADQKARLRARAEAARARVAKGESFAAVAREVSDDRDSAEEGGDLGVVLPGMFEPGFEKTVLALKPGELSAVIEGPAGFHVIRAGDRVPSRKIGFDEVRSDLRDFVLNQARRERARQLVEGLRKTATIEIP